MADFERLVAAIGRLEAMTEANQAEMLAKIEANQEKMDTTQEKKKAKIRANNKFEVFQRTLISHMDAHHTKTEANHEKLKPAREASHEMIEALMDVRQDNTGSSKENAGIIKNYHSKTVIHINMVQALNC
jgi:alpha-galactosidase/6-phospho-beta-glucosidase family protein